jgi:hypothetical protein
MHEDSTAPPRKIALVTPSDSTNFTFRVRGISFAAAGALSVVPAADPTTTVIIPSGALAAGIIHPLEILRVNNTGTGATGIVAYGG